MSKKVHIRRSAHELLAPTNETFPEQTTDVGGKIEVEVNTGADSTEMVKGRIIRRDLNGRVINFPVTVARLENGAVVVPSDEDIKSYIPPEQNKDVLNRRVKVHMTPNLTALSDGSGSFWHRGTVIRSDAEEHGHTVIRLDKGHVILEEEAYSVYLQPEQGIPELWVDEAQLVYGPRPVPDLDTLEQ
jgi:hypothetical protein